MPNGAPAPSLGIGVRHTKRSAFRRILLIFSLIALAWIVLDASIPRRHSLRDFDPHAVARLETDMWRSYYDHHSLALFFELTRLLHSQYHLSVTRSFLAAYHAAHAAVVFQPGKNRQDYERALPDIDAYWSLIRAGSESPFNPHRVAQLELEWWIVHRQRARRQSGDLVESLAALQAEIYRLPIALFKEHAQARADAMTLCDQRTASNGATDADWIGIYNLLDRSWVSLKNVI
jgi:hypothetical protein